MEEGPRLRYKRPSGPHPTRHLLIAKQGPESDISQLKDQLITLGAIHMIIPGEPPNEKCLCTFETIDAASAAAAAITSAGKFVTKYSDAVEEAPKKGEPTAPVIVPAVHSAEDCGIPGLFLYKEFVTPEEEEALISEVDDKPWNCFSKRKVQHYGCNFNYTLRTIDPKSPANPFPQTADTILPRILALPAVGPVDQLTVNDYPAGVGISPHVETHSAFGDAIVALSLLSSGSMVFRRDGVQKSLFLPRRSLVVMSGEARFAWSHYVPHRKYDLVVEGENVPRAPRRVSFTFRKVREEPCRCDYPTLCDCQEGVIPPTRDALAAAAAQTLEDSNVNDVYNAIAPHFSATRFAIWPAVRRFVDSLPSGAIVADVGCGNGKYFAVRPDIFTAGSDRSDKLAAVAARRLFPLGMPLKDQPLADVLVADGLRLPYRKQSCDAVLCIAVLHHMASVQRRLALLKELLSVLVPGGRALVTVWATEQENMKKVAKWEPLTVTELGEQGKNDYLVPWHLPMHRVEAAAAAKATAESALDADKNALVFKRYYHLFEPGELTELVEQVPGASVVECFYDKDNWCIVMQRDKSQE